MRTTGVEKDIINATESLQEREVEEDEDGHSKKRTHKRARFCRTVSLVLHF